ncbi:MAG: deoxyuridine 5'-triphosphate nucleotidohydrolase [Candidatus Norongarragalinales archaeon]
MILSKSEILELILKEKLVEGYVDLKHQLQPASFDLTVAQVFALESPATIDFDNSSRKVSKTKEIPWENNEITLAQGEYKIQYNETVRLPADIAALTVNRSSLGRSGCIVQSGWWDPGYHGKGGSMLTVGKQGLHVKKNAKVAQMVFMRVSGENTHIYEGAYHKENI